MPRRTRSHVEFLSEESDVSAETHEDSDEDLMPARVTRRSTVIQRPAFKRKREPRASGSDSEPDQSGKGPPDKKCRGKHSKVLNDHSNTNNKRDCDIPSDFPLWALTEKRATPQTNYDETSSRCPLPGCDSKDLHPKAQEFVWVALGGCPGAMKWPAKKEDDTTVYCKSDNTLSIPEMPMEREEQVQIEETAEFDEDSESEEDEDKVVAKTKKAKQVIRQKWTETEVSELQKYFKEYLETRTTPRSRAIEKAKLRSKRCGGKIFKRANHLIIKKISNMNHASA